MSSNAYCVTGLRVFIACLFGLASGLCIPAMADGDERVSLKTAVVLVETAESCLIHLYKTQGSDGSWGDDKNKVGNTAVALLCFLGNGNTHLVGLYKKAVKSGLQFLLAGQTESGGFGDDVSNWQTFLASLALSETYAISRDSKIGDPATSATKYVVSLQRGDGGFSDSADSDSDAISTAFATLALKAAKMAKIEFPSECFTKMGQFLTGLTDKDGRVGYRNRDDKGVLPGRPQEFSSVPLTTAAAGISLIFSGTSRKELTAQHNLVSAVRFENEESFASRDSLYVYFSTYFSFQVGGKEWISHANSLGNLLEQSFVSEGENKGAFSVADPWAAEHGSIWTDCFFTLTTEIGSRYIRASGSSLSKPEDIPYLLRLLNSSSSGCRFAGRLILEQSAKDPKNLTMIAGLLKNEEPSVREAALSALSKAGAVEFAPQMVPLLKDPSQDVRLECARALGKLNATAVVVQLAAIAKDEKEKTEYREDAIRALGEIGGEESVGELILLLRDTNSHIRFGSAHALGEAKNRKAILPLIEALRREQEKGFLGLVMRSEYVTSLKLIATEADLDTFKKLLSDDNEEVRAAAAGVIGNLGSETARKATLEALKHADWRVVSNAASALADNPDEEGFNALLDALSHPDDTAKKRVVEALEKIGDKRACLPLINLLQSASNIAQLWSKESPSLFPLALRRLMKTEESLCWKAASAIAKMGDNDVATAVVKMLASPSRDARACAAWLLGEMEVKTASSKLKSLLTDKDLLVSAFAAAALVRLGDRTALVPLSCVMAQGEPYYRYEALRAAFDVRDRHLIPVYIFLLGDEDVLIRLRAGGRLVHLTGKKFTASMLESSEETWDKELKSWREWWSANKDFLRWQEKEPYLYLDEESKKKGQPIHQVSGDVLNSEAIEAERALENAISVLLKRNSLTPEQIQKLNEDKASMKEFLQGK